MGQAETANTIYDLLRFFAAHEYVFLYGAGKIAHQVLGGLKGSNLAFEGCCVSHKTAADALEGLPVHDFPSVDRPLQKCGFVLAMKEAFQAEALEVIKAQSAECGVLCVSKGLMQEIAAYLSYEPKPKDGNIVSWHDSMERLLSKPTILLKRNRGLGDVLAFEPCARKFREMGYQILVATEYDDIFRHNHVADGVFGMMSIPSRIETSCIVFDMTHAYAITPFSHMVDGYIAFVRKLFPDFSLSETEKMPVYDASLIRPHGTEPKKICVNNEATEWKSRIYDRDKMRQFVLYLKRKGYEIYEIGKDEETYLGVGENCFGIELHDTVRLMSEMDLYVGLDNGLLHLAQSIHLPIFALFGCVCPLFRIHDWSRARVMWKNTDELACAGCWSRRRMPCDVVVCDQKEHYCMDWSVEQVIYAFEHLEYDSPPQLYKEIYRPLREIGVV